MVLPVQAGATRGYCTLYNGAGHANKKKDIQDLKLSNNEHVALGAGSRDRNDSRRNDSNYLLSLGDFLTESS